MNATLLTRSVKRPRYAWLYLKSRAAAPRVRGLWDGVQSYAMFVGYPRSGHSLTGALLNAHPNAVIAHELDALRYAACGFSRDQLLAMILERDREFARGGRAWEGYDYRVPTGWEGRFERLRVVGDKKGGQSAERLSEDFSLLDRLRRTVRVPLRVIHVVRNPFDNIATIARRHEKPLDEAAAYYFGLCETAARVKLEHDAALIHEFRHEDFVALPREGVRALCAFLGLEANEPYVEACASVVFESPSRSRERVDWPDAVRAEIERGIERFEFLNGYSLER